MSRRHWAGLLLSVPILLSVACGGQSATPSPSPEPKPTPDLGATVEAAVAMALPEPTPTLTPDIDATVEARLAAMLAVAPTATILPTASSAPSPTPAPQPTAKPTEAAPPIPQPENLLSEMVERVRTSVGRIESLAMTGSGVIFDTSAESAFIVTNYHVVEGVAHVDVLVDESTLYSGEVLGTDNVRDLAVSEFDVPTRTVDGWDYGFLVRDRESGQLEVVGLDDTGWFHENVDLSEDEYTTLDFGPAPSATGVTNELLLILIEEFGFFFVNQDLTATLDLSHNLESGDVSVMGAFYVEHLASPTYRNFNVWVP